MSLRARLAVLTGLALVQLALALVVDARLALARPLSEADTSLTFRAREQQAGELEIEYVNRTTLAARRLAVSDIVLRLRPSAGGQLSALLSLPEADRPAGRSRVLFTADIIIAAGGRILIEERARCGPWRSGASICRTECEGGTFALMRTPGPAGQALTLRVGRIDASEETGVRLGACAVGGGPEPNLQPRQGRSVGEVQLDADGL